MMVAVSEAKRRGFSAGLPVFLLIGLALQGLQVSAAEYTYQQTDALAVGIHHPMPRLCYLLRPSQRDLRVLRLGFGLTGAGDSRLRAPWYLEPFPKTGVDSQFPPNQSAAGVLAPDNRQAGPGFTLLTERLWDLPPDWLLPQPSADSLPPGPLQHWVDRVAKHLGRPLLPVGEGVLTWQIAEGVAEGDTNSFLWSRLRGDSMLPAVADWQASAVSGSCAHWPAGVWLEPATGPLSYRLVFSRPDIGRMFTLYAYREVASLWAAFRQQHLDAVLLEGPELDRETAAQLPASRLWGREIGGQQIVIRFAPHMQEVLGIKGLVALSRAIPRATLAQALGERLVAARGFFTMVSAQTPAKKHPLQYNPRQARRSWLDRERELVRPQLAVLIHPTLEDIAQRIASQWQRTLNLSVSVVPLAVDRFEQDQAAWRHDAYLTVVDLHDGSLQDLWNDALGPQPWQPSSTAEGPGPDQIAQWEATFLETLPYLPVLQNAHWMLAQGQQAAATILSLCPACQIPGTPPQLSPQSPP